jgi:hypothetical protein
MIVVINFRDASQLRDGLISINPDVSHRATEPPAPSEIYTPPHHVSALDPDNSLVVGIRGAGKSFWAGALGDKDAKEVAAAAYPRLALEKYIVSYGFTGFEGSEAPSPETLQQHAQTPESARLFWRIVILREFLRITRTDPLETYSEAMKMFVESEKRETAMREADQALADRSQRLLLIFDALDTLSNDWPTLSMLTKSLLEVTYAMRSYRSLRLKLFLRPEQLDDPSIGFTDLSKLKAGKIDLSWDGVDLYGLLFSRLANESNSRAAFAHVLDKERIKLSPNRLIRLPNLLARDKKIQERVFTQLAGSYMGSDHRKGKTYTWLPKHLADGFRLVTPRSFLTALRRAAEVSVPARDRVFTVDGIKEGLRAASRVRVDQLKEEYKWIEFALLPLEGLRVPCDEMSIIERWLETKTVDAMERDAKDKGYLGPSEMPIFGRTENRGRSVLRERGLLATLLKIGVLEARLDGRINMPDIFRIGAAIIGRGRIAPEG